MVGARLKNAWVLGVRILSFLSLSSSSVQHISALTPIHSWDFVAGSWDSGNRDKRQRQRELVWEERVRAWGREGEGAEKEREKENRNVSEYTATKIFLKHHNMKAKEREYFFFF